MGNNSVARLLRHGGVLGLTIAAVAGCGSATSASGSASAEATTRTTSASPGHSAGSAPPAATTAHERWHVRLAGPGQAVVGDGAVWATSGNRTIVGQGSTGAIPQLLRLDPRTGATTATVSLTTNPFWMQLDGTSVHVLTADSLVTVDASTMRITAHPAVDCQQNCKLAFAAGSYWITDSAKGIVNRIDPRSGAVLATARVTSAATAVSGNGEPLFLDAGAGFVWASMESEGRIAKIDPATGTVVATYPIPVPWDADGDVTMTPAVDGGLWLVWFGGPIVHLDPATGATRTLTTQVPTALFAVAVNGALWVGDHRGGEVWQVDAADGGVVDREVVSAPVYWVAGGDGLVVADSGSGDVTAIDAG